MLREINMYVPFVPSLCIIIFLLFYYFYLDTRYNISIYFPPTYSVQNIKNPQREPIFSFTTKLKAV